MKYSFLIAFILLLPGNFAQADTSIMRSDAGMGADTRRMVMVTFREIDFNNNTLGETVLKLNSMVHNDKDLKGQHVATVLLNLDGFSEPQITEILARKIVNWTPMSAASFGDILAAIAQFTNCQLERRDADVILTPLPSSTP